MMWTILSAFACGVGVALLIVGFLLWLWFKDFHPFN